MKKLFIILSLVSIGCVCAYLILRTAIDTEVPAWVNFPNAEWERVTPEQAGLDRDKFMEWVNSQNPRLRVGYGGQEPEKGGIVITRGGYLLYSWGDPDFRYQSKSLGKTFTRMVLQLALDKGVIKSLDHPVQEYWTGEGQLSHPHKYLNRGFHTHLTFRHFIGMTSGFPVTNGYFWEKKTNEGHQNPGIPSWANWTGNPDYDNYAHVLPGERPHYSSGGYWRLAQILTAVWNKDLKDVLDEYIMSKIGIPAGRWDWLTGQSVRNKADFYPDFPNYGGFLDPPYAINGHQVRGGPGWVVMSAEDFARLGLLYATRGLWRWERLISEDFGGRELPGNGMARKDINTADGYDIANGKEAYVSFGKVASDFKEPTEAEVASWIIGPVQHGLETPDG